MTNKQAVEILARAEKASNVYDGPDDPGGWCVVVDEDGIQIATKHDHPQLHRAAPIVCMSIGVKAPHHRIQIRAEDAEFMAASRTDVPALVADLKEMAGLLRLVSHDGRMQSSGQEDWLLCRVRAALAKWADADGPPTRAVDAE